MLDDMFSHYDKTYKSDGQTDRQTDRIMIA